MDTLYLYFVPLPCAFTLYLVALLCTFTLYLVHLPCTLHLVPCTLTLYLVPLPCTFTLYLVPSTNCRLPTGNDIILIIIGKGGYYFLFHIVVISFM